LVALVNESLSSQTNQNQVITEEKTFLAYFNQTRFTKRLGSWIDLHHRSTDHFVNRPLQSIGRLGLTFYATDHFRITFGYCFAYNYPSAGFKTAKIEHRPWQQLFFKQEYHKVQTIQILRLEERYNQVLVNDVATDDYVYTNRLRYSYLVLVPFSKQGIQEKKFFGVVNDELFVNFGKNITYNTFDQNRFFVGLGYQIGHSSSVHLGYMNIYQQLASGDKFNQSHCLRLFFYHNLDFRKEKS
jgi:hypothetical protein